MIVANDDQHKQDSYNGPTVRPPEPAARRRRSFSPLPDYEASEAQYRKSLTVDRKRSWHQSKTWRTILFLLLTYTFLTIVVGVPIIVTQLRNRQHDDGFPLTDPDLLANQFASSGPGITYTNDLPCNSWNETKLNLAPLLYTATLDMQLPLTGDISIRSNATLDETPATKLSGNLLVEYDPNLNSDSAFISVSLHTSTLALREATRVCYSYDGPDRGISIFFPNDMTDDDLIDMDIRVVFPQSITPTIIPNFNVFLPMFTQNIQDLTKINFGSVNIDGSFRTINVTNIQAPCITVKNMIGDIMGVFNASETLILDTLKGIVDASITLVKPIYRTTPTKFLLDTGDESINAKISLVSPASDNSLLSSPHFFGTINNFNAPVTVAFTQHNSQPAIPVRVTIQNSLAATDVVMDQKFEGSFVAQTRLGRVSIDQSDGNSMINPFASDTPRTIVYKEDSAPSRRSGWISGGKEPPNSQSRVEIYSSLGPIGLHFGPT